MEERRQFERVGTTWTLAISMPGGGDHRNATTLNVSASGAAVEVEGEMLTAGNVQIAFQEPAEVEAIACSARIVWVGSGDGGARARLGLHYLDISETDRARLREVLYGSADAKSRAPLQVVSPRDTADGLTP